jgi:succinate dehydrogenase / fumarate reductase cytochrome b subunit
VAKRPATSPPQKPETWVLKVIMAVTGSVFVAFLLFHMAGNLKVYLPDAELHFNEYAHWLRGFLNPLLPGSSFLWAFRAVIALCLVLHVYAGTTIFFRARVARGGFGRAITAKWHALTGRTMIWTGLIILCFIIFHLLDLTVGAKGVASKSFSGKATYTLEDGEVVTNAYQNLIGSFERPAVAAFYIITMVLIAIHLSHGIWSIINDFGGTASRTRSVFLVLAGLIALVIVIGNASIPLAVLAGVIS